MNTSAQDPYGKKELTPKDFISEELDKHIALNSLIETPPKENLIYAQYFKANGTTKKVGNFVPLGLTRIFKKGEYFLGLHVNSNFDAIRSPFVEGDIGDFQKRKDEFLKQDPSTYKLLDEAKAIIYEDGLLVPLSLDVYQPITSHNSSFLNVDDTWKGEMETAYIKEDSYFSKYYFAANIKEGTYSFGNGNGKNQDVIYMDYQDSEEDNKKNYQNYYITLGRLIDYINVVLRKFPTAPTISPESIWGRTMPSQISLDPRVCIVRNSTFYFNGGNKSLENFPQIKYFNQTSGKKRANFSNVYISFKTIVDSMESNLNEVGSINPQTFLEDICNQINKALGGINNLQPNIDRDENLIRIADLSLPSEKIFENYPNPLQIYGYKIEGGKVPQSTFVRNVDLKTEISPQFASMVTIGSTAAGYGKGMEATAFSKWNRGIFDRFKPNTNNLQEVQAENDGDDPLQNYISYLNQDGMKYLGFSLDNGKISLDGDIIPTNLSVVTEYYKYLRAASYEKEPEEYTSTSNGFIPFNLQLTMDGISGMKIYNKIEVDTRFLPSNYKDTLKFIIKRVSHKISNGDWETSIDTDVMPGSYTV
jgi:hypothetical protein